MTQNIYFNQVKVDGPKKKLLEFQNELNFLNEKEMIYFESLFKVLAATDRYAQSEVTPEMLNVIMKCLELPKDKVFPALDVYRIYLTHPNSTANYSGSDAGSEHLAILTTILQAEAPKATTMLALRCLTNLFINQSCHYVALKRRQQILEAAAPHLMHEDKNVRQAAATLVLNYSVSWQDQDDEEGRVQAISALAGAIPEESDLQTMLRMATAIGNLAHGNEEAKQLVETFGIQFPPES